MRSQPLHGRHRRTSRVSQKASAHTLVHVSLPAEPLMVRYVAAAHGAPGRPGRAHRREEDPMSAQVSRRAVLEAVGAVGGAGLLFESMGALGLAPTAGAAQAPYRAPTPGDFSLTGRRRARVVVLGAGIAGLTAAYELGKAGYDCVVLEASSRPGGRNWTIRGGTTQQDLDGQVQTAGFAKGQYLNAGPARIAQWMVTMDYCRELGVAIEPLANQNGSSYIYHKRGPLSGKGIRYRRSWMRVIAARADRNAPACHEMRWVSQSP